LIFCSQNSDKKWQNLRDYFKEILKKQKISTPLSGAGAQEVLEPMRGGILEKPEILAIY